MADQLRLTTVPAVVGGHLEEAVPLTDAKTFDGRTFIPLVARNPMIVDLVCGDQVPAKNRIKVMKQSDIIAYLRKHRDEQYEKFFDDRDANEKRGFDKDGNALGWVEGEKQHRRMKSRRTMATRLELPTTFPVSMPAAGDAGPMTLSILASNDAKVMVQLTTEVIFYLHQAFRHSVVFLPGNSDNPPGDSSGDPPARPEQVDPREERQERFWFENAAQRWTVPWYDTAGGFHRKYFKHEADAQAFYDRVESDEPMPPPLPQASSPSKKKHQPE